MAAWSIAECAAARLRVDIERPLITPGAGQHLTAEAREALREGAIAGRWIARDVSPLRRTIPLRLPAHREPIILDLGAWSYTPLSQREIDAMQLLSFRLKRR